jgi:anti-anti-sigma regulatory factor
MLSVTIHNLGEVVVLRCVGRIVRGEETLILCAALRHRSQEVIIDLTRVHALDAAGVGALVSLQAAGVYLKLQDPNPRVRNILSVTKVDSIVEICYSPSSGDKAATIDVIHAEPGLSQQTAVFSHSAALQNFVRAPADQTKRR